MEYIYMYGMIVNSTLHSLIGDFPKPDEYIEIDKTYSFPGGETGSGGVVVSNFGINIKLAGALLGAETYKPTKKYFEDKGIDCSDLEYNDSFEGFNDTIFIWKDTRTIFGKFAKLLSGKNIYWSKPKEESIKNSTVCSIDPFFYKESQLATELAMKHNKKYTTIDNYYDNFISKNAEIIVCSTEFIDREYKDIDRRKLFNKYLDNCNGLVIFTFGKKEIIYGRRREEIKKFIPYEVNAVDTLGAGDAFKGAVTYGIYKGWDDDYIVKFASAVSAIICTTSPGVLNAPNLKEVTNFMKKYELCK